MDKDSEKSYIEEQSAEIITPPFPINIVSPTDGMFMNNFFLTRHISNIFMLLFFRLW